MADEDFYYMPLLPQNLQGVLHTPEAGQARVKQLRQQHAGNPAMQQRLAVDDRYWQGREMTKDNPLAALGALVGSVPYDAAKLAYFHGPKGIRPGLEKLTERLFPGEGFNPKTTARPSLDQYRGYTHGMAEGMYQLGREGAEEVWMNGAVPKPVAKVGRAVTQAINRVPTVADALMMISGSPPDDKERSHGKYRNQVNRYATQLAVAHAMDPVGSAFKIARTGAQTLMPQFDTQEVFEPWMSPEQLPITRTQPMRPMTPAQKKAQNAQLSRVMSNWDRVP